MRDFGLKRVAIRFLFLWLLFFSFGVQANETISVVPFQLVEANATLDLLPLFTKYAAVQAASNQDRKLVALHLGGFTASDGKPVQILVNDLPESELSLSKGQPDSVVKIESFTQSIAPLFLKDLKKLQLIAQSQTLIGVVGFEFDTELSSDYEGTAYKDALDRIDVYSQQALFDPNNLGSADVLTRFQAMKDLLQYPSKRAYEIAADRFDFHGEWIDYDLKQSSFDVVKTTLKWMQSRYSETETYLGFLNLMYQNPHSEIREIALYATQDMKTAAALGMVLQSLGDSYRSFNPGPEDLLNTLLKKPGVNEAVTLLVPAFQAQFKKILDCGDQCEAESIWIAQGMLQTLEMYPSSGFLEFISPMIKKGLFIRNTNEAALACLSTAHAAAEIAPLLGEYGKTITEAKLKQGGFPSLFPYRKLAAHALMKMKNDQANAYIKQALLIKGIEPEVLAILKAPR